GNPVDRRFRNHALVLGLDRADLGFDLFAHIGVERSLHPQTSTNLATGSPPGPGAYHLAGESYGLPGTGLGGHEDRLPGRLGAPRGERGARQDEYETDPHSEVEGLMQYENAQGRRNGGIDVGDDGRPNRPHLGDQGEKEQERDRRADHT